MKITSVTSITGARRLVKRLNACHDGSLRTVCIRRQRNIDRRSGSLIYPFRDPTDFVLCDIDMELILNSYAGAKKDQIVRLRFERVRRFTLRQDQQHDSSELYEVVTTGDGSRWIRVIFYATKDRVAAAELSCETIVCEEL